MSVLLPGLFWAAGPSGRTRGPAGLAPLALVLAAMVLGGFPGPDPGLYALAAYLVVRALTDEHRRLQEGGPGSAARPAAAMAGGGLLGLLVSAVYLLPFAELLGTLDLSYRDRPLGSRGQPPTTCSP